MCCYTRLVLYTVIDQQVSIGGAAAKVGFQRVAQTSKALSLNGRLVNLRHALVVEVDPAGMCADTAVLHKGVVVSKLRCAAATYTKK